MTSTVRDTGNAPAGMRPRRNVANTHVHLPPNFSAFSDVESVVERAREEGLVALGTANYFDYRIYDRFTVAATRAGIAPLHGIEIITIQDDLRDAGVLVNDPANPGRTYLCGKGITDYSAPRPAAAALMAEIRHSSEERIAEMAARLATCVRDAGLGELPAVDAIVAAVAARNGVPTGWVSLQERHLARAVQETVVARTVPEDRPARLAALLGVAPDAATIADPIALQELIRSRLMKAGRPAFVPEAATSWDDAYRLVLELGGVPCYPTLADGASPICAFEDPPEALAAALVERHVYTAELIPPRNAPAVVDHYVRAFREAGILVLAGTEHNTERMIPLEPACKGQLPLSEFARTTFWEGTCVIAAHQHERMAGRAGYVDETGALAAGFADAEARIRWFRELGEQLIEAVASTGAQA